MPRCLLLAPILYLACGTSTAAEYLVDQFAIDAPDLAPGDGACNAGLPFPPSGGQCTLRAAIMETNANPGPDTVLVPWRDPTGIPVFESIGGPVSETIVLDLAGSDSLSQSGDLDIRDDLTVSVSPPTVVLGWSSTWEQVLPVIDASALGDRIFEIHDEASDVTLSGLVLSGGGTGESTGGAVRVSPGVAGEVTLLAVDLVGNRANAGAAIMTSSPLSLVNSRVRDNESENNGAAVLGIGTRLTVGLSSLWDNTTPGTGGVVEIRSGALGAGELRVLSSVIVDNAGSAVVVAGDASAEVQGSTITGNSQHALLTRFFPDLPAPRLALSHTVMANQGASNCRINAEVVPALQEMDDFNFEDADTCEQLVLGTSNQWGMSPGLSGPAPDTRGWHRVDRPLPGSPLIDAGATEAADFDGFGCVPLDLRFLERPRAGQAGDVVPRCDIGAIEFLDDAIFRDGLE